MFWTALRRIIGTFEFLAGLYMVLVPAYLGMAHPGPPPRGVVEITLAVFMGLWILLLLLKGAALTWKGMPSRWDNLIQAIVWAGMFAMLTVRIGRVPHLLPQPSTWEMFAIWCCLTGTAVLVIIEAILPPWRKTPLSN